MLRTTHPHASSMDDALARCVEACLDCSQTCTACADACIAEPKVDTLRQCIRLNLDCADVCSAAGTIATRHIGTDRAVVSRILEACAAACKACGDECAKNRELKHCAVCADACRTCEKACYEALDHMAQPVH
jgi:hypothetical protein